MESLLNTGLDKKHAARLNRLIFAPCAKSSHPAARNRPHPHSSYATNCSGRLSPEGSKARGISNIFSRGRQPLFFEVLGFHRGLIGPSRLAAWVGTAAWPRARALSTACRGHSSVRIRLPGHFPGTKYPKNTIGPQNRAGLPWANRSLSEFPARYSAAAVSHL